ncbi:MAG: biotin/lipoyl-binding protein, partial [Pseudomonadota bacterium]
MQPEVRVAGDAAQTASVDAAPSLVSGAEAAVGGLQTLLKVEADLRSADSVGALAHLVANEVRKLSRARQVFVFQLRSPPDAAARLRSVRANLRPNLRAVSSVSTADGNAPLVQALGHALNKTARGQGLGDAITFDLYDALDGKAQRNLIRAYPLRSCAWVPCCTADGRVFAGLVLTREIAWRDDELVIASRLAGTAAHAWRALKPSVARPRRRHLKRGIWLASAIGVAALMAIPVPMSALAPFEIIARDAVVVAAPLDAVVARVEVRPNARVAAGQALLRFDDTTLRSRLEIAERELRVAQARLKRANQVAFGSMEGRRELAIARGERDVRAAELAFAHEMMERTVLRARDPAVAIFGDAKDLVGRPVKTGERLMELADPAKVQAEIFVPVADGGVLSSATGAKLFLDADPLN